MSGDRISLRVLDTTLKRVEFSRPQRQDIGVLWVIPEACASPIPPPSILPSSSLYTSEKQGKMIEASYDEKWERMIEKSSNLSFGQGVEGVDIKRISNSPQKRNFSLFFSFSLLFHFHFLSLQDINSGRPWSSRIPKTSSGSSKPEIPSFFMFMNLRSNRNEGGPPVTHLICWGVPWLEPQCPTSTDWGEGRSRWIELKKGR